MPIAVQCGSCSVRLNAPDQAAGKAVRCPKCKAAVVVPKPDAEDHGFEVVDDPPPLPTARPAPRPVKEEAREPEDRPSKRRPAREDDNEDDRPGKRRPARDEAEEDDRPSKRRPVAEDEDAPPPSRSRRPADEDDDRPRSKGKPARKNLKQRGLIAGAVGGVLFVAVIGVSMYQITSLSNSIVDRNQVGGGGFQGGQFNNQPPVVINFGEVGNGGGAKPAADPKPLGLPAGWEKFKDPLNEIEVYFPFGQPEKNQAQSDAMAKATGGPADIWTHQAGGKDYILTRMTVSEADLKAFKPDKILTDFATGLRMAIPRAKESSYLNLTVAGKPPTRVSDIDLPNERKRIVVYSMLAGNRLISLQVKGGPKITRIEADIFPFFENLKSLK